MEESPELIPGRPRDAQNEGRESPVERALDEQTCRWRRGERVLVEVLLLQWPELRQECDALLDLIYNEVILRERRGEEPLLDEYVVRFPTLAVELEEQFEVHRALQQPSHATETDMLPGPDSDRGFPGYEILGEIGRGGMGVVYKAWQKELKRVVALKMLRDGALAGTGDLSRFRIETEAIARLQHPNIVQIFEVGGQEAGSYFAMEFVDGASLEKRLTGQPMSSREAAELIETLARAIHYAHERGVIHRDLKPSNILLTAGDLPKITDFGLAKLVAEGHEPTQTGSVLGTPSYMAPEQAGGKRGRIGPATDVYALGAILYELLTGRPPFKAESAMETIGLVIASDPIAPSRLRPRLPRDLETICLKCLSKEPGRRYNSALALAEDLHRYLRGEPVLARPVGRLERGERWARRNPLVAALVLVVLGSFSVITEKWLDADHQRRLAQDRALAEATQKQKAQAAEKSALESQEKAVAAERLAIGRAEELEKTLYYHTLALAHHEFAANHLARAEDLLSQCKSEFRGWEWRYLQRVCRSPLLAIQAHSVDVMGLDYSPDGRYLASSSGIFGRSNLPGEVRIWDVVSGKEFQVLGRHSGPVHAVRFSPDGRRLATGSEDGRVNTWEVSSGELLQTFAGFPNWVTALAFHPDGKRLAVNHNGQIVVWDLETLQQRMALDAQIGAMRCVAFSPDGKQIASGGYNPREVRIWDAEDGRLRLALVGHTSNITGVAYHPRGRMLASAGWDGMVKVWDTVEPGKELLTLRGGGGPVAAVAYDPAGQFLATASADGNVRTWSATDGELLRTFRAHTGSANALAFTADGRCVASGGDDGAIRVWDPETDQGSRSVPVSIIWVGGLAFHHDGKWLAVADVNVSPSPQQDRPVAIRAFPSGTLLRNVGRKDMILNGISLHSPSQTIALAGADRTIELWDAGSGRFLHAFVRHKDEVTGVAFHPDGKTLASVSKDKSVRIWGVDAGALFSLQHPRGELYAVAFSPDGRRLAVGGQDTVVEVWDVASRRKQHELRGHSGTIHSLAFSPDGELLASCGDDPAIRLWHVPTGREVHCLQGHTNSVSTVAFHPDGKRLVSASKADRSVKIWSVSAGKELLTLDTGYAFSAAFSPDGEYLVAGRNDTIKIWDARMQAPAEKTVRLQLGASLTQAFFHADRREWAEAALALTTANASGLKDPEYRYNHAALLLLAGKPEEYRQVCRGLAEEDGVTSAARTAYMLARICTLDAESPIAVDRILRLARVALVEFHKEEWYRHALGLAHYRAGHYEEAGRELVEAMDDDPVWSGQVTNWLALSMCLHRQGRREEARQWLRKAVRWMDNDLPAMPRTGLWRLPLDPHDWLACHILRAEAESLIGPVP